MNNAKPKKEGATRLCALALASWTISLFSPVTHAAEWTRDVEVVQLSAYQHSNAHFVWFSPGLVACAASPVNFNDNSVGGKSLMVILTTAIVSKRRVDVQTEGCSLIEVYLR